MLHPVCQPKMPYQCEQLKVGNAYHLPPRKRQKVDFPVGQYRLLVSRTGHAQEFQIKLQVVPHQSIFAHKFQKCFQRSGRVHPAFQFCLCDSRQLRDLRRQRSLQVHQGRKFFRRLPVPHPDGPILHDRVRCRVQAGRFQVDHCVIVFSGLSGSPLCHFLCHLVLCCLAEPRFQVHRLGLRLGQRAAHQLDAVKIHSFPAGVVGAELHPLLPCRRVDQCRLPVFQVLADTVPHCIPDAAAHIAHINAGVDLTQPLGQVAAQAGRAVGHGQNYDGSSPASRSK